MKTTFTRLERGLEAIISPLEEVDTIFAFRDISMKILSVC
jgi:hypothetical protein